MKHSVQNFQTESKFIIKYEGNFQFQRDFYKKNFRDFSSKPYVSPLFSQTVFPVKFATQADVKVYEVKFETQADLNVFRVDFQNQATDCDGLWFYPDFVNQAQWKIFFTNFQTQADLKIFYVKFRNQAGWRNEEKKQLYCSKT